MSKKTAVVIANNIYQPRIQRRIDLLLRIGYTVHCYAFRRNYYTVNEVRPDLKVYFLGDLSDRRYFRRLFILASSVRTVRQSEGRAAPDLLYCFGLDCAGIGVLAGIHRHAFAYEIADLRYAAQARSLWAKSLSFVERQVLKRVTHVALTSEGFIDQYRQLLGSEDKKLVILENKLPVEVVDKITRPKGTSLRRSGVVRIGFIGLIRYLPCLLPFMEAVGRRGDRFQFIVFGDGSGVADVEELARKYKNIKYFGPFRNPQDLERIYGGIDLVFSVYDNRDFNVRLAIPNKLFESVYFCKPLIVADKTALAERVQRLGVGFAIDPFDRDYPDAFLDSIGWEDIVHRQHSCMAVETGDLVISDDALAASLSEDISTNAFK